MNNSKILGGLKNFSVRAEALFWRDSEFSEGGRTQIKNDFNTSAKSSNVYLPQLSTTYQNLNF